MKPTEPSSPSVDSRYNIEALARGLEILSLFTPESPSLSFSEVVSRLHLSKSTAFRALVTLETMGYLERVPSTRHYRPGLKVLELGFTALSSLELRQVARPHLERLALETNETTSLAVLDELQIIYVDRIRNRSIVGVMLGVGDHVAAHCTALGKVLLADLPPADLVRRLTQVELTACTAHTTIDSRALMAELATISQLGYAVSDEQLAVGLRAVAAPIRNATQRAVAAINVSGPVTTISLARLVDEIAPLVVNTAALVSRALGAAQSSV
jgi:IclR family transcriptional regulator, pca regulon regulatory protein